jgi:hypothetical protein
MPGFVHTETLAHARARRSYAAIASFALRARSGLT